MEFTPHDATSPVAPYEQLRIQIAARVARGELTAGTRLPTVRALAEQLGLAVNTVARTYKELEADGVVVTEGRRGTFIKATEAASTPESLAAATAYVDIARRLGLGLAEATRLVEQHWTRAEDEA